MSYNYSQPRAKLITVENKTIVVNFDDIPELKVDKNKIDRMIDFLFRKEK